AQRSLLEAPAEWLRAEYAVHTSARRTDGFGGEVLRREHLAQPASKVLLIVTAHCLVGDRRGDLGDARFKRGAAFRRVEWARLALAHPQYVCERPRRRQHIVDRRATAGARKIVGILPIRQRREFQTFSGLKQRQREITRRIAGPPPRFVAVETENRLVGHAPHQGELLDGQRSAERRDGCLESGGAHGYDVDITSPRDNRRAFMRGFAG